MPHTGMWCAVCAKSPIFVIHTFIGAIIYNLDVVRRHGTLLNFFGHNKTEHGQAPTKPHVGPAPHHKPDRGPISRAVYMQ